MWLGLNMFLSRAQKPVFALALADELPLVLWQPVSTEVIPTSIKPNKIRRIVLLLAIGVDSEQVDSPWSGIADRFSKVHREGEERTKVVWGKKME